MEKHTRGPWNIDISDSAIYVTDNNDNKAVCKVPHLSPQAKADARLIASSPELLAALEMLLREVGGVYSNSKELAEAERLSELIIIKARGER